MTRLSLNLNAITTKYHQKAKLFNKPITGRVNGFFFSMKFIKFQQEEIRWNVITSPSNTDVLQLKNCERQKIKYAGFQSSTFDFTKTENTS